MGVKKKQVVIFAAWVLIPPLILAGVVLHLSDASLSAQGTVEQAKLAAVINIAGALSALILLLVGLVAAVYVKTRRIGAVLVCSCLVFTLSAGLLTEVTWRMRLQAFHALAERSDPLVSAIHDYVRIRGEVPTSLTELTPDYLDKVPSTGIGIYPDYEIEPLGADTIYAANRWLLRVPISRSPVSELLYLPLQNYDMVDHEVVRIGAWIYVYAEAIDD